MNYVGWAKPLVPVKHAARARDRCQLFLVSPFRARVRERERERDLSAVHVPFPPGTTAKSRNYSCFRGRPAPGAAAARRFRSGNTRSKGASGSTRAFSLHPSPESRTTKVA